ncbi:MAG: ABC transporter permease [Calditrichaeota bacterium]|nr:MAG: ABC transporter permease [Calditrichota bacterium]
MISSYRLPGGGCMNESHRYPQLLQLISSLFKEIIREPGVIFWGIVFPILMALGLGIAFTKKSDIVRTVAVIADSSWTKSEKTVWELLEFHSKQAGLSLSHHDDYYRLTIPNDKLGNTIFLFRPVSWKAAIRFLKRGNTSLILEEKNSRFYYHFDPLNPEAQLIHLKLSKILQSSGEIPAENSEQIKPLTLEGTRYIDFLVPGLIAMGIMMSCMWGISYGLIDKRTKKLLRRMIATPMRKSYFLIALITVRIGMNFIESTLLFIFAFFFFNITIQGGLLALAVIFIAGNIAFSGIAIFTSSRTANTEIGNGLINAVVLPMMVLSGIFFSYHNFPEWSIPVIKALPLTLLADATRSVFIEGAGPAEVFIPTVVLSTIGIVFFVTGLKYFRWY